MRLFYLRHPSAVEFSAILATFVLFFLPINFAPFAAFLIYVFFMFSFFNGIVLIVRHKKYGSFYLCDEDLRDEMRSLKELSKKERRYYQKKLFEISLELKRVYSLDEDSSEISKKIKKETKKTFEAFVQNMKQKEEEKEKEKKEQQEKIQQQVSEEAQKNVQSILQEMKIE